MAAMRPPAVAGKFYPATCGKLQAAVTGFLHKAETGLSHPKALIVPHAGYLYSGPVAATAYARIGHLRDVISRVLLIGPAHYVKLNGLAVAGTEFFSTPLGDVPVDTASVERLLRLPQVILDDAAHQPEHCLEVQLPFLQQVLDEFRIVPLLAGKVTAEEVAEVIDLFWDDPENLIVISSDLSHFHDYETATRLDAATSAAIGRLDLQDVDSEHACGYRAIRGLIHAARRHGAGAEILDVRNSGDTSGSRDRVVGYGAYAFE